MYAYIIMNAHKSRCTEGSPQVITHREQYFFHFMTTECIIHVLLFYNFHWSKGPACYFTPKVYTFDPGVGGVTCTSIWISFSCEGMKIDPQAFSCSSPYVCHVLSNIYQLDQNISFRPILHDFARLNDVYMKSPSPESIPKFLQV